MGNVDISSGRCVRFRDCQKRELTLSQPLNLSVRVHVASAPPRQPPAYHDPNPVGMLSKSLLLRSMTRSGSNFNSLDTFRVVMRLCDTFNISNALLLCKNPSQLLRSSCPILLHDKSMRSTLSRASRMWQGVLLIGAPNGQRRLPQSSVRTREKFSSLNFTRFGSIRQRCRHCSKPTRADVRSSEGLCSKKMA